MPRRTPNKSARKRMPEARHDSVLVEEVLAALDVHAQDTVVDATLGGAGHFAAILARLGEGGTVVGIDADPRAVDRARLVYAEDRRADRPVAYLVNDNFRNLRHILDRLGLGTVDKTLFDLGWSGFQIAEPRGFSFQRDEPLLMTYAGGGQSAADLVNRLSEADLADLLYGYGEERFARGIASAIVAMRARERILSTKQLVAAVESGTPRWYRQRKIHPATKTFQALRIAVNDELGALRDAIMAALKALSPGGRLAVITFHSIEDRVVKNLLRDAAYEGYGSLSPKKPIVPSRVEALANRRARSAKLRVFERTAAGPVQRADADATVFSYA